MGSDVRSEFVYCCVHSKGEGKRQKDTHREQN